MGPDSDRSGHHLTKLNQQKCLKHRTRPTLGHKSSKYNAMFEPKLTANSKSFVNLINVIIIIYFATICLNSTTWALSCYCNECDEDYCNTSDHTASRCFMTYQREVINNTYVPWRRYGCLSGAEDSIATLQCNVNTRTHTEPIYIACCKENDCNLDLSDPTEADDPRWGITLPASQSTSGTTPQTSSIWLIVALTVVVTFMALGCCVLSYEVAAILFERYCRNKKSSISQGSICSFADDSDTHLKSQFINQHLAGSSTASTHTYSLSFDLPQKSHDCATIENTSTLPDLTSGVGTRVLEPRTMARVVDSGETVFVGSGRFGRVFKGTYHCEDVAVKAFRSIDCESWRREENILKQLNHENVVRFIASETYAVGDYVTETWMFLEFCPYGSLCDYLDRNEICGPQQAVKILYSIIKGLNYLHEDYSRGYKPPIAHRDIKSRNILMRTPETCCLADFGHAIVKVNEETLDFGGYERLQVGTVRYMAPEILRPFPGMETNQFHTFAQADLYQFGLVLWEVCHRTALDILHPSGSHMLPYDDKVPPNPDIDNMIKIVCEDNYRPLSSPYWKDHPIMEELASLMVECWRERPKARMETLGVKKKLKELFDQITPQQTMFYNNNLIDSFSMSPNLKIDKDKTKSTDHTL